MSRIQEKILKLIGKARGEDDVQGSNVPVLYAFPASLWYVELLLPEGDHVQIPTARAPHPALTLTVPLFRESDTLRPPRTVEEAVQMEEWVDEYLDEEKDTDERDDVEDPWGE